MSFYTISSSSSSIETSFKIPLLKWEECDTIGKKIGYIAGSAINTVVSTTANLANKVFTFLNVSTHLKALQQKVASLYQSLANGFSKIGNAINEFATPFYQTVIKPLFERISKLGNEAYLKSPDFTKFINSFLSTSQKFLKELADRTIVPLYNHVISPIVNFFKSKIDKINIPCPEPKPLDLRFLKPVVKGLNNLANWTIVPFGKHIVKPILTVIGEVGHGMFSGCIKAEEEEEKEKIKEKTL